ncbi:MAG TPA: L-lactate permease [Candidatus Dormibacteraeota bacterium]|nr:L-lactate permease [Candidatus Dormibacteraeota bacterium]
MLLTFHQSYQPVFGSVVLSALGAGLPLYVLFVMLAVLRLPAWICAIAAMLSAFVLAWLVWGMRFGVTAGTATEGMAFGLWPGMTSSMAIALSKTGFVFPFVAAFLGWLGVFLTGSDTSSNTLFGPLQAQTAQQLGNVSPILTAGTNSSGGVMGKMISPQNLSVGAAGVNKVGSEGAIFRRVIGYSLILTTAVGIVAMIEAYVIPGIVPTP